MTSALLAQLYNHGQHSSSRILAGGGAGGGVGGGVYFSFIILSGA